jgi:hypothetical protein
MDILKGLWMNIFNDECSRRSSTTVACVEVTEQIHQRVWHNSRTGINEIAPMKIEGAVEPRISRSYLIRTF